MIAITQLAHEKSKAIANAYHEEIAWFGLVTKKDNQYIIHDIFVPQNQRTSAVNVHTSPNDMAEAMLWATEQRDVEGAYIGAHFHSHVNMTVTPSVTDVNQLEETMRDGAETYIHLIYNKKGDYSVMLGHLGYVFKEVKIEIIGAQNLMKWAEQEVSAIKELNKAVTPYTPAFSYDRTKTGYGNNQAGNNQAVNSYLKKNDTVIKTQEDIETDEIFYGRYRSY